MLERWLDRHAGVPVRLVAGGPGTGKTSAVALWARARAGAVGWLSVPPGAGADEVAVLVRRALGDRSHRPRQLVIDAADAGDRRARAVLARLGTEGLPNVTFVYLARSLAEPDLFRAVATGIAVAFDAALLRFDDADAERLCRVHGIDATPGQRARLLEATAGWATAVSGTIRYAAGVDVRIDAASARWIASSRVFLNRLVDEALLDASPAAAEAFHAALRGDAGDERLEELAAAGLFVDVIDGRYEINPVIRAGASARRPARTAPAAVQMFGRFRITIGDREVEFVRRRDRQILQYLMLQPDGAATRATLLRVFWPHSDPQLAAQALRTACSTIRRAFAEHVGRAAVDLYVRSDGAAVRLRADNVHSTLDRFRSHVDLASIAEEEGRPEAAFAHWAAALRLYSAPLLSGEPPAPWIDAAQHDVERLASIANSRVAGSQATLSPELGEAQTA